MYNQLTQDPEIPQGGTIRETIGWQASVPDHGTATHTFYLLSIYGTGNTVEAILGSMVAMNYITTTTITQTRSDIIDSQIALNAPLGTYSCATVIAENYNPSTRVITGVWDFKIDANILSIVTALGARIISTSFVRV